MALSAARKGSDRSPTVVPISLLAKTASNVEPNQIRLCGYLIWTHDRRHAKLEQSNCHHAIIDWESTERNLLIV